MSAPAEDVENAVELARSRPEAPDPPRLKQDFVRCSHVVDTAPRWPGSAADRDITRQNDHRAARQIMAFRTTRPRRSEETRHCQRRA